MNNEGETLFAGPTYEDIFKQRIRIGTFSGEDMPNHVFLAVLTAEQIAGRKGKKWLEILKREGFEFIRTTDNSVYTGKSIPKTFDTKVSSHSNYIFGLFRNISSGLIKDPFTPPKAWTDLPDPYNGDMSPKNMFKVQSEHWKANGPTKLLTEQEVEALGAPVTYAGRRLPGAAPELKEKRLGREKAEGKKAYASPFG